MFVKSNNNKIGICFYCETYRALLSNYSQLDYTEGALKP